MSLIWLQNRSSDFSAFFLPIYILLTAPNNLAHKAAVFPNMRHCAVTTRQKQTENQRDTEMAALSLEDTR